MADLYKSFRSQTEITATQEANRKARQLILDEAKRKFEINEAKKEKARRQGEGTWMLDSVSHRINKEEKVMSKAKKKSKKKKKKKKKKGSSSSSDSDSEEEKAQQWVEATSVKKTALVGPVKGPQLQREGWMEAPLDLIPTTSRQEIRDAINKDKEEAKRAAEKAQEPGQHSRELNPHWRDGGSGLPEEKQKAEGKTKPSKETLVQGSAPLGDGGYSWLQKAYSRCVQQAEDEGRSLEEVAAERYGSLKKLQKMLAEAKQKMNLSKGGDKDQQLDRNSLRERRRSRSVSQDRSDSRERRGKRSNSGERQKRRSRERKDRSSSREKRRERSESRERRHGRDSSRDRSRRNERSKFKRPGSDDESNGRSGGSSRPAFRRPAVDDEDDGSSKRRTGFMRPSDSGDRPDRRAEGNLSRFTRPGDERRGVNVRDRRRSRSADRNVPRWKKKTEVESERETREDDRKSKEDVKSRDEPKGREGKDRGHSKGDRKKRSSSSPSSSSDSSSDSSDDDSRDKQPCSDKEEDGPSEPPPKVLSEEELNELAAKILRAEIMGEDELAADLKAKLDNARQLREASKSSGEHQGQSVPDFSHRRRGQGSNGHREGQGKGEEEDNVVVLSRTSKGGMVRPVQGGDSDQRGARPGKKRKKAVTTHDISGDRTIYFDDDNKFDLKSLVEQEKAGTAEDQNAMFARLAGRAGDRDLDVDDMFVSKAARKQNEEGAAARDRSAAIFEHRKISAAMEKCNRCFDKVPKHLIIAIGAKSYLCLPPHRSLTEGHCLIVPMQHVSSCVAMDEDVWREMQLFRKTLVQMFLAQDEDVVVMETVMHLKHFPHTAIECIPLEKEVGDLAPIYFKKAIQDAGPEWADNKKLHSLREKDIRHVIPKGFPYFSVDFGLQGGYATAIEDEQTFPSYFGREIVGGMIDAEPSLWRKPHKQSFEDQRQKVLKFEAMWRPYDWTQNIDPGD